MTASAESPGAVPPATADSRVRRPLRLSWLAGLGVLVFLVGGSTYLLIRAESGSMAEVEVLVPVREIRPYQVIVASDLTMRTMHVSPGPSYVRERDKVENRYALTTLTPDRPIAVETIGTVAPAGLSSSFVFTVEGGASVSLAGRLNPGSQVDVLLPGGSDRPPPVRIEGAFVLDVRTLGGGDRWAVTLSVARRFTDEQASLLAEGRVNLVRRPSP